MRVTDATDETFASLTSSGTVVVAFYMSPNNSYKALQTITETTPSAPSGLTFRPARRPRRTEDIRKALASAAWSCSRSIRVVFADLAQCPKAGGRLGIGGWPDFVILKDGVLIAKKLGGTEGGHRDSYRIAREHFVEWLSQHLSS